MVLGLYDIGHANNHYITNNHILTTAYESLPSLWPPAYSAHRASLSLIYDSRL